MFFGIREFANEEVWGNGLQFGFNQANIGQEDSGALGGPSLEWDMRQNNVCSCIL